MRGCSRSLIIRVGVLVRDTSSCHDRKRSIDFAALVQTSLDIVGVIDRDTRLVYANDSAQHLLGLAPGQQIGALMSQRVHPDDLPRAMARLTDVVAGSPTGLPISVRVIDLTGRWKVLELVCTNRLDDPNVAGIVLSARDVTDRNEFMEKLRTTLDATILALASVVDLRDPYTAMHQREVANIAVAIARELRLTDDDVKGIEVAANLHDIGKIAIPIEILNRPGRLSPAQVEIIKTHSQSGADIVADVPFPWPVADMILQHHERLDGSGYPKGLTDGDIPVGPRILAVADVVSAISAHRPYRPARGAEAALAEIRAHRGVLYDPAAVDACLRLAHQGALSLDPPMSLG